MSTLEWDEFDENEVERIATHIRDEYVCDDLSSNYVYSKTLREELGYEDMKAGVFCWKIRQLPFLEKDGDNGTHRGTRFYADGDTVMEMVPNKGTNE